MEKSRFRPDRRLVILVSVALIVRILFAIPAFSDITRCFSCYDGVSYDLLARHMLDGKGFSVSLAAPYQPNSTITPGYPGFLTAIYALTGGSRLTVILIQILLNVGLLVLLYRFTKKRFNQKAALWAGLILTVDLNMIFFTTQLTTETLFTFLLFTCIVFILRFLESKKIYHAIYAGGLLGAATLVRPIALYFTFPVLIVLFLAWLINRKNLWRSLAGWAIILVIQLALITPWIIRNRIVFGQGFYTTISDVNLYKYHAVPLKSILEEKPRPVAAQELENEAIRGENPQNEAEFYRLYGKRARQYLLAHPFPYMASLIGGGFGALLYPAPLQEMGLYFHGDQFQVPPGVSQEVSSLVASGRLDDAIGVIWEKRIKYLGVLLLTGIILYGLIHIAKLTSGVRAYVIKGLRSPCMLLFLVSGLYFLGLLSFGFSPRARLPVEPLLAILAGAGITAQKTKPKRKAD